MSGGHMSHEQMTHQSGQVSSTSELSEHMSVEHMSRGSKRRVSICRLSSLG